ncbi:MAG: four helix bundle protein [Bacteroidia bacterium]
MNSFEELEVWKECRQLKIYISKLSKTFLSDEKYKLTDQIIRSSRSVNANISEGFGRFHFQENIQYCRQARGSLFETLEHIYTAFDEQYIDDTIVSEFKNKYEKCLKLLNGYIAYLLKVKAGNTDKSK